MLYAKTFKYANEAEGLLTLMVKQTVKETIGYKKGKKYIFKEVKVGFQHDDFLQGLATCLITFNLYKVPRILNLKKLTDYDPKRESNRFI